VSSGARLSSVHGLANSSGRCVTHGLSPIHVLRLVAPEQCLLVPCRLNAPTLPCQPLHDVPLSADTRASATTPSVR
jgi:hypothetical protein